MTQLLRQRIPLQAYVPQLQEVYVSPKGNQNRPIVRTSTGKFIDTTGSTTDGIQEAINHLAESNGGRVLLSSGIYTITSTLTLKKFVSLIGCGMKTSIIKYNSTGIGINISDVGGVDWAMKISDLSIVDIATGTHGIEIAGVVNIQFNRIRVADWNTSGIHFKPTAGNPIASISIHECEIEQNDINIICDNANSVCNAISITNSRVRAPTTDNIYVPVAVLGWHIAGNDLESGTRSLYFGGPDGFSVVGNYFEATTANPIIQLDGGAGQSITGNTFIGYVSSHTFIKLGSASLKSHGVNISGNFVSAVSGSTFIDPINVQGLFISGLDERSTGVTWIGTPGAGSSGITVVREAGTIEFIPDVNLYRSASNILKTDDTFAVGNNILTDPAGFIEGIELGSAPAAPSTNRGRIFFEDNGAGKTRLVVRFNTGAVQVLATEP